LIRGTKYAVHQSSQNQGILQEISSKIQEKEGG
jgi:hypothetical protein